VLLAVVLQLAGLAVACGGVWLLFGTGWAVLFTGASTVGVGLLVEYGKPRSS